MIASQLLAGRVALRRRPRVRRVSGSDCAEPIVENRPLTKRASQYGLATGWMQEGGRRKTADGAPSRFPGPNLNILARHRYAETFRFATLMCDFKENRFPPAPLLHPAAPQARGPKGHSPYF
jgi:hypothetical protein